MDLRPDKDTEHSEHWRRVLWVSFTCWQWQHTRVGKVEGLVGGGEEGEGRGGVAGGGGEEG